MMREYMTQLTEKQVINICDGRILGYVSDFKIDPCDGRLTAIILPGEGSIFSFKRSADIVLSGAADRIEYKNFLNKIIGIVQELYFS